jgi:endonuclease/exonuclease/phosphatase family metal-dependent hydrolase
LERNAEGDQQRPIRVLTLNAHQGFNALRRHSALLRIRQGLRESGADLVFLQEIGVAAGAQSPATQYEILADTVWREHAYGRNAVITGGHHGNALLSKFPISAWQNLDVSVGRAEPRGMLHCVLEVPGLASPLHAICVHFALLEGHRAQQVRRLVDFVASAVPREAPLVIAGDFNDWRGRAQRALTGALPVELVHADARGRPPRTFPARVPVLRLDRIYVRNFRHRPVELPRGSWARLSDHEALACDLWPECASAAAARGSAARGATAARRRGGSRSGRRVRPRT